MHRPETVAAPAGAASTPWTGVVPLPIVLRGHSRAAERQRAEVRAAVVGRGPVLITSEPGLDALAVARLLHGSSAAPLVLVGCADSSADQLHEVLFGGPDAGDGRPRDLEVVGRSAALAGSVRTTIVLADVAELPAGLQRRLARVLRDGEVYVRDGRRPVRVQTRIVGSAAATLDEDVRAGRFRSDLYRRLAARRIALVPLRDRAEDVPDLVRALAEEIAAARRAFPRVYAPAALTALASLPWPGNLDELRELLARLHAIAPGTPARQEDVLRAVGFGPASPRVPRFDSLRDARRRFEREYIGAVLAQHRWRMAQAATTLGIERANLYRKVRQLGLTRPRGGNS